MVATANMSQQFQTRKKPSIRWSSLLPYYTSATKGGKMVDKSFATTPCQSQ